MTTSELAAYILEITSFDDGDLDILTPGLFPQLNLSPKWVSHRQYFAEVQSQYLGLCAAHDDCDWLREKQPGGAFFPLYQRVYV